MDLQDAVQAAESVEMFLLKESGYPQRIYDVPEWVWILVLTAVVAIIPGIDLAEPPIMRWRR